MDALRVKKGPVVLPLLLLAAALAAYTLTRFQFVSAADCLTLGRQHLNELNYEGAIVEFTNAIELDPNNVDARIGLAQAYVGGENYAFAQQILEPVVYTQQPVEGAASIMVEILEDTGRLPQAVSLAQTLIATTDKDEYYDLLDRLLDQLHSTPRALAAGTDQALLVLDGQVFSQGSNALGQLGTALSVPSSDHFISAQFPGKAARAACAGRTSLVIDQDGGLWAAGENRWGQWGAGCAGTVPEGGWTRLPCPGTVVDAAGTTGRLLILLDDATLWTAGAGSGQSFERLARFPAVAEIAAVQGRAALLTAGGALYVSDSRTPDRWELTARDACSFTLSEDCLCWVDGTGAAYSDRGSIQLPPDGAFGTDGLAVRVAQADGLTLCVTQNGSLWRLRGNTDAEQVPGPGPVAALYPQGGQLILEYEDGTIQVWAGGADAPQPLV